MSKTMQFDWFTAIAKLLAPGSLENQARIELENRMVAFMKNSGGPHPKTIRNWRSSAEKLLPPSRLTQESAEFIRRFCRKELSSEIRSGERFEKIRQLLKSRVGTSLITQRPIDEIKAMIAAFAEHTAKTIREDGSFGRRASNYKGAYTVFRIDDQDKIYKELLYIGGPGEETVLINYGGYIFRGCSFVASTVVWMFLVGVHPHYTFCFRFLVINSGGDSLQDRYAGLLLRLTDYGGGAETAEVIVRSEVSHDPDLDNILRDSRTTIKLNLDQPYSKRKFIGVLGENDPGYDDIIALNLKRPYESKTQRDIRIIQR